MGRAALTGQYEGTPHGPRRVRRYPSGHIRYTESGM